MPPTEDVQVVAFVNEQVRPLADKLYQTYYQAKQIIANYEAGNIGTLVKEAGSENKVKDGADIDGRRPVTGGDIWNFITTVQDFVNLMEGIPLSMNADRRGVVTLPHVNDR